MRAFSSRASTPTSYSPERPLRTSSASRANTPTSPTSRSPSPSRSSVLLQSAGSSGPFGGGGRPTTGDTVTIVSGDRAGQKGKVVQDEHDSLPFNVHFFDDGETYWYSEEDVRKVAPPAARKAVEDD